MKVIGITGGVGAGKSEVLHIIEENCSCYILIADLAAHEVEKKGSPCYDQLVFLLGSDVLNADWEIDRSRMAEKIFANDAGELLKKVNAIVHPAVKKHILQKIEEKRKENSVDFFFIEAALLIEDGYTAICDELWYIMASRAVRERRLMESRGYSRQKVEKIMNKQADESVFLKYCKVVIDNEGIIAETKRQIIKQLKLGE